MSASLSNARAQSPQDSLLQKFSVYRTQHIQEKLFIHLDRTVHLCGETLWFSVYSVHGTTHQPLNLSKVAYVEILSDSNESVVRAKVELNNGMGAGSFFIPATLNTGNYVVRGYTQWMKNYDESFFFHQAITIINPFRSDETNPSGKQTVSYDAQFLPEGGSLVDGLTSKVGFRVTDTHGKGIDFNGSLINAQGDTVVRFSPAQLGIGTFEITPATAETYQAVIIDRSGHVKVFPFPKVFEYGYTLRVERTKDELRVNIQSRQPHTGNPAVHLFVHTRNQIIHSTAETLINGKTVVKIPVSKLGDGISHITLFDASLNPVCERLIFTVPEKKLVITPRTNIPRYSNREEVNLTLDITTESQSVPEIANLSVSVYKLDSLPSIHRQTIHSYLLLTSDLHGQIESPQTYFQPGMEEAIDRLMLTHGWRRFRWNHIFRKAEQPKFFPEIMGLTVRGKLTDASGRAAPNVQSFLSLPSRNSLLFTNNSTRTGQLSFLFKNVYGQRPMIFQTNFSKDSLNVYTFTPEDPFAKDHSTMRPERLTLSASLEKILIEKSIGLQVEDIFKKEETKKFRLTDSTAFYGKPDATYRLDDYTRFTVIEEVMREYVPGVLVTRKKGEFYLRVHDIVNHGTFYEEPLILLDGVPIFDTDKLMKVDPLKVQKLEVVTKAFFHGQSAFAGIVSFTTYKGDLAGFEPNPASASMDFEGLQLSREFYQPQYETQEAKSSREPDARNLLMWAPRVTVVDGKAELRFYTSDQTGHFQIEVEGLSRLGRTGSGSHSFWVGPMNK